MAIFQSLKENWEHYSEQLKIFIFGENNSRLDKMINRYYSMRTEKRKKVRIFGIAAGIILLAIIVGSYAYSMLKMQNNLNTATKAYVDIQEFKPSYLLLDKEFLKISSGLTSQNRSTNLLDAIQQLAQTSNVQIASFSANSPILNALPSTSVLKSNFKLARIEFAVNGISIKHLVNFLNALHKLPNKFVLTKLEISQLKDNKLYFNSNITVETYVPNTSSPSKSSLKKG